MNDVVELRVGIGGIHFGDAPGGSAALTAEKFLSARNEARWRALKLISKLKDGGCPPAPVQKCTLQEMKPRPPDRGFPFTQRYRQATRAGETAGILTSRLAPTDLAPTRTDARLFGPNH
jgi:hypothetical protein